MPPKKKSAPAKKAASAKAKPAPRVEEDLPLLLHPSTSPEDAVRARDERLAETLRSRGWTVTPPAE